jgi:hypothetical protein
VHPALYRDPGSLHSPERSGGRTEWRAADCHHPLAALLDSGCRTGWELAESWARIQGTSQQACAYLGRELQGALAAPVEGMSD